MDWVVRHWTSTVWPVKVLIIIVPIAILLVWALASWGGPIKDLFAGKKDAPAAASGVPSAAMSAPTDPKPVVNVNAPGGQVQVGDHNVQHQNIIQGAVPWPRVSRAKRDELVTALRTMTPQRFVISARSELGAPALAQDLYEDLVSAGWPPELGILTPIGGAPGKGIPIRVKAQSKASDFLLQWLKDVGFPAGIVGTLKDDDPVSVRIDIESPR